LHIKSKKDADFIQASHSVIKIFSLTTPPPDLNRTVVIKGSSELIETHFVKNNVLDAEIIWTFNTVKNHHSYKSNENIADIFQQMFYDSVIASKFSCGEKKTAYYSVFGIAPYVTNLLQDSLLQRESYVLLFDESLNNMRQKQQMDIYTRFWSNNEVKTTFLTSVFLGHQTAEDLFDAFIEAISPLKLSKVLQISMDGPNVNWKFFKLIQNYSQREFQKHVLNIGSCGLHILHNAFKHGCFASKWEINNFLSSLYYLFKDSPARREDFVNISKADLFPKKFVNHRWLESIPAADCALKLLPELKKYILAIEKQLINKPTSKSFSVIKTHLKDNLLSAKLNVFISIAKMLYPFLTLYQTDKPMIFFLADDLSKIVRALMTRFIKCDVLLLADTPRKLLKVDVKDLKNHLPIENIDVGFCAERTLKQLHQQKKISDKQLFDIKMECKLFLIALFLIILNNNF